MELTKWKARCEMVEVLKAGLFDSIQDLGRCGYQQYGVPISGAMDQYSAKLANGVLGNSEEAAVLEFTLMAPKLKFHCDTAICVTGMESQPKINGKRVENNTYLMIKKNDVLSFGTRKWGCRGYLSVLGGFNSEKIMESRSFYKGITGQERLINGDMIMFSALPIPIKKSNALVKTPEIHFESETLDVLKGVDFKLLINKDQNEMFNRDFTVSKDSNRMAYQLEERIENTLKPIITSPVLPGTVQLTPSGQLMILMRDCQATGGYPRILQLSEMAINRLSQKTPGDRFQFKYWRE